MATVDFGIYYGGTSMVIAYYRVSTLIKSLFYDLIYLFLRL